MNSSKKGEKILISSHTKIAVDHAIEGLTLEDALRVTKPEKGLPSVARAEQFIQYHI